MAPAGDGICLPPAGALPWARTVPRPSPRRIAGIIRMSDELSNRILRFVGDRDYRPAKVRALARAMGVDINGLSELEALSPSRKP